MWGHGGFLFWQQRVMDRLSDSSLLLTIGWVLTPLLLRPLCSYDEQHGFQTNSGSRTNRCAQMHRCYPSADRHLPSPTCSDLCAEAEAGAGHQMWARPSLYLEQTALGIAVLLHLPF